MVNSVIDFRKLENVLQTHWAEFLDTVQVMRFVLEQVRDTTFKVIRQADIPPRQMKVSVTRFAKDGDGFEVWIEFTVPKNEGVVIGTVLCSLSLLGELRLKESFGTEFQPEILNHV